MTRKMAFAVTAALAVLMAGYAHGENDTPDMHEPTAEKLEQALAGEHRSERNKARDQYRHPKETLAFFGLRHDMTVVEILPGSGWYTQVLAPVLREEGQLYAAHFSPDSEVDFYRRMLADYRDKLAAHPDVYDQVKITVLAPPEHTEIAPPESADRVLTFRSVHNWIRNGVAEEAFAAMARALKPGGVLGVVQHRAGDDMPPESEVRNGYVHEDTVIELAESAGLRLDARSEINANPDDTRDHPEGVWTLPPTLRLGEKDRERYLEIGESDRMTLRFIK
ncbi:MAG: methyltransferase [Oleiphilaceae bacterium]|nr:methyltransferase [Oleiphilaceae bacterium]